MCPVNPKASVTLSSATVALEHHKGLEINVRALAVCFIQMAPFASPARSRGDGETPSDDEGKADAVSTRVGDDGPDKRALSPPACRPAKGNHGVAA